MAGIPGRRLFVATPLPATATEAIAEIVEGVRALGLPDGVRDVRWVRLDGLHLTLRFIGPTLDDRIADAAAAVIKAAAGSESIRIALAGSGTFPAGRSPRAIWIGVSAGVDMLDALSGRVEAGLAERGWPLDGRPFRPHLTLARSDGIAVAPLVAGRLAAAMAGQTIACTLDSLGLFESVTGGGPARYVAIESARLGTASERPPVYHPAVPDRP